MKRAKVRAAFLVGGGLLAIAGTPTYAQDSGAAPQASGSDAQSAQTNNSGIADIIVTARRSSENVQNVPLAVTAVGSEQLRSANVVDVKNLQAIVPNLITSSYGNGGRVEFAIRGQRGIEGTLTSDEPIGAYIDEINYPRVYGLRTTFFDIDRVEVVKGPQGTLFGKNNTGGAVSITTRKPYMDWGGFGQVDVGSYGAVQFTGALNAPIVADKLAVRISTQITRRDGYGRSLTTGQKLGDQDVNAVRFHALFTPSTDVSFLLSADYARQRNNGSPWSITNVRPLSNPGSIQISRVLGTIIASGAASNVTDAQALFASYVGLQPGHNPYDDYGGLNRYDNVDMGGVSGTLTIKLGKVDFKSITAYRVANRAARIDFDATPFVIVDNFNLADKSYNFSQELQLSSFDQQGLDWIVGAYYNRETGHEDSAVPVNPLLPGQYSINDGDPTNDSKAVFGQAIYYLTPDLRFTGGLRYTEEGRRLVSRNRNELAAPPAPATCAVPSDSPNFCQGTFQKTFRYMAYLASLDWKINPNTLVYVNTSRSQRAGGFPLRGNALIASFQPFIPEVATNYEAGLKTELFNRRVRFNMAAFYTDYKDIQKSVNIGAPPIALLTNAAAAHIYGGEVELTVAPVNGLTLNANGGWTHARYQKFLDVVLGDRSKEPFSAIPEWTYSLGATYNAPTSFGSLGASVNWNWQSDEQFRPEAAQPQFTLQRAYGLLDARLSAKIDRWGIEVAVYAKNLTKKIYYADISSFDAAYGYNAGVLGEPRTFGVMIRKNFGKQ